MHPEGARRQFVERIALQRLGEPCRLRAQPVMLERQQAERAADVAEGVHVALALAPPAGKFDAKLEAAARLAQEFGLVQPQRGVEQVDLRDRRLAHPHGADGIAFHQRDRSAGRGEAGKRRCRHPPGGTATGDHISGMGSIGHCASLCAQNSQDHCTRQAIIRCEDTDSEPAGSLREEQLPAGQGPIRSGKTPRPDKCDRTVRNR